MVCGKCGGSVRGYIDASNTRPLCKCKPDTETIMNVIRHLETKNDRLKNLLREVVNGSGQEMSGCYAFCFKAAWLQKAKQAIGDEE